MSSKSDQDPESSRARTPDGPAEIVRPDEVRRSHPLSAVEVLSGPIPPILGTLWLDTTYPHVQLVKKWNGDDWEIVREVTPEDLAHGSK